MASRARVLLCDEGRMSRSEVLRFSISRTHAVDPRLREDDSLIEAGLHKIWAEKNPGQRGFFVSLLLRSLSLRVLSCLTRFA